MDLIELKLDPEMWSSPKLFRCIALYASETWNNNDEYIQVEIIYAFSCKRHAEPGSKTWILSSASEEFSAYFLKIET